MFRISNYFNFDRVSVREQANLVLHRLVDSNVLPMDDHTDHFVTRPPDPLYRSQGNILVIN